MGHHDINYKGNKVQTLTASKKHLLDKAAEPYNGNSEGPYKRVADKMDGVFRKETINYKIQNGLLVKETAVRTFTQDGKDYHDTTHIETISRLPHNYETISKLTS
tara:strand:- start:2294 stop:2608 length:315 start_codon:yes stop_codon:yes gene_type:complete